MPILFFLRFPVNNNKERNASWGALGVGVNLPEFVPGIRVPLETANVLGFRQHDPCPIDPLIEKNTNSDANFP